MATPIYNGGVSAQIKAVMDRTRAAAALDIDFLKHKVGMVISVGGTVLEVKNLPYSR